MLLADDELNTGISRAVLVALRLDALKLEQSRNNNYGIDSEDKYKEV